MERPRPEQTLEINCWIRKAVAFEITLINPLPEIVSFEAFIDGEGLIGD